MQLQLGFSRGNRETNSLRPVSFSHPQTTNVHSVLSKSSRFVEAEEIDSTTDVDTSRADAEDAELLEPRLGDDNAAGHGSRQCWWHHDRHQIEGSNDTVLDCAVTDDLHCRKQFRVSLSHS